MWKVLEHSPVDKLEDNLWCVEGEVPRVAFRRRMSVVRLGDERLVLHSPMALGPEAMAEIDGFGTVSYLVVPNGYHRMDAAAFRARYPNARLLCPAACKKRVEKAVAVDGVFDELPADPALALIALADNKQGEVALRVVHADGGVTVILNDAVFNVPHQPGMAGLMMRLMGSTGGPRVTRIGRMIMVRNAAAFADALRVLAATQGLRRLVVSHGDYIDNDPSAVLRAVADDLYAG